MTEIGKTILLMGRSGCGKGTQAEKLIKYFNAIHIYTGELLRELAKKETYAGKKIDKIINHGGLPEPWIAVFLWQKELLNNIKTNKENIIFDAVARRIEEAKMLDEVLGWFDRKIVPILINVPREEAFKRLAMRNRADDSESSINSRLDWYETSVRESVDYYKKQNRLLQVDGTKKPDEVFEEIMKVLRENETESA